jgi:hypothetical protein
MLRDLPGENCGREGYSRYGYYEIPRLTKLAMNRIRRRDLVIKVENP